MLNNCARFSLILVLLLVTTVMFVINHFWLDFQNFKFQQNLTPAISDSKFEKFAVKEISKNNSTLSSGVCQKIPRFISVQEAGRLGNLLGEVKNLFE